MNIVLRTFILYFPITLAYGVWLVSLLCVDYAHNQKSKRGNNL